MNKITFKKISPNGYYAGLLQDAYSGTWGETKNNLQFLYFSYLLSNYENEFAVIFENIANEDLYHHKILGQLIVKLGGDPVLYSKSKIAFSGGEIENVKGIRQMLEISIEIKEKSILNYMIILAKIPEKEIKNILEMIICDEKKHKDMLENMLKKYQNNG